MSLNAERVGDDDDAPSDRESDVAGRRDGLVRLGDPWPPDLGAEGEVAGRREGLLASALALRRCPDGEVAEDGERGIAVIWRSKNQVPTNIIR